MTTKSLFIALLLLSAAACAQTLPLGSVTNATTITCPHTGFMAASCTQATVSCPNTVAATATWGIIPAQGTQLGTYIFVNGKGDTVPTGQSYVTSLSSAGFQTVQLSFKSYWEYGGNPASLMAAACLPATVIDYIFKQVGAPFCSMALSSGAGGVGYALSWYGLGADFDNVEMISGPVFSDLLNGCKVPGKPTYTVNPTDGAPWSDGLWFDVANAEVVSTATGYTCRGKTKSSAQANSTWKAEGILATGASLNFPQTNISGWVCNNGINDSASEAAKWITQLANPYSLTSITNCNGSEDVTGGTTPSGELAQTAILVDMTTQCYNRHLPKIE